MLLDSIIFGPNLANSTCTNGVDQVTNGGLETLGFNNLPASWSVYSGYNTFVSYANGDKTHSGTAAVYDSRSTYFSRAQNN